MASPAIDRNIPAAISSHGQVRAGRLRRTPTTIATTLIRPSTDQMTSATRSGNQNTATEPANHTSV